MKNNNYWKNQRVLVTGGTSGLGRALALGLLKLNAKVAIMARTKDKIDELTHEYPDLVGIQGDVSSKTDIHPVAAEVQSRLGNVDVLFNVASYLGATPLRLLVDTNCEDLEQVLQTNVVGPFRLTKAIVPAMLLRKRGLVVNISSDAAIIAYPTWGSYSLSKAAIDHQSRVFDEELKDQGVRFLSIDPGDMNTPMHFAAIPDADPKDLRDPREAATRIINIISSKDFSAVRRKA